MHLVSRAVVLALPLALISQAASAQTGLRIDPVPRDFDLCQKLNAVFLNGMQIAGPIDQWGGVGADTIEVATPLNPGDVVAIDAVNLGCNDFPAFIASGVTASGDAFISTPEGWDCAQGTPAPQGDIEWYEQGYDVSASFNFTSADTGVIQDNAGDFLNPNHPLDAKYIWGVNSTFVPPRPFANGRCRFEVSDPLATLLDDIDAIIAGLLAPDEIASGKKNALGNKINVVRMLLTGDLTDLCEAIDKLSNDILPKMDGEPSPADWVLEPTKQQELEALVLELLGLLTEQADAAGGCP